MIGAIFSTLSGLGKMMTGGVMARREEERQKELTEQALQEARNEYESDFYRNVLDRSDVQSMLGRARDESKRRIKAARATAAVTGGTPEAAAAIQQAEAAGYGQTVANAAARGDSYRERAQERYDARRQYLEDGRIAYSRSKAFEGRQNAMSGTQDFLQGMYTLPIKSGNMQQSSTVRKKRRNGTNLYGY